MSHLVGARATRDPELEELYEASHYPLSSRSSPNLSINLKKLKNISERAISILELSPK
jgi:hypothetical protein